MSLRGARWRLHLVRVLFGGVPPFVGGRLRTALLRAVGVRVGRGTAFWDLPKLLGTGPIDKRLTVGSHCGFNKGCIFDLAAPITIGDYVDAGHDVAFLTSPAGRNDEAPHGAGARPIVVGNGVWFGARATVMPGVSIGAGSVIGAGVVVDKDVPENTLFTGAPPISIARWR